MSANNNEVKGVVCKFVFNGMKTEACYNSNTKKNDQLIHTLTFRPVYGNSEENKVFWKYTPSGTFEFATINEEAAKMFKFGHEYYVTFKDANPEDPAVLVQ